MFSEKQEFIARMQELYRADPGGRFGLVLCPSCLSRQGDWAHACSRHRGPLPAQSKQYPAQRYRQGVL